MKVIKTNIKAETVEINPREALRNTFQDNRRTYNDNIRKYATGRVKLKSCRGFDKQKAICDIWNKFKTNKEKVRICITYVSGTFE